MDILDLAAELNLHARDYEIGGLQRLRVPLRNLKQAPSSTIFGAKSIHKDYAFHLGGRSELQFNVGIEDLPFGRRLRHGVAFSLEPSQTLPTIDTLIPKIARFNEYIRQKPEDVAGFLMWHWASGKRSEDRAVHPITDDLIQSGLFIVLGKWRELDRIEIPEILGDFDRLLPLYVHVESSGTTSKITSPKPFTPGCPPFLTATTAKIRERTVEVSLRHVVIQQTLFRLLCEEAGADNVQAEHTLDFGCRVDVVQRASGGFIFYEIKTNQTVQSCIREAIGQLLEYAYWPAEERAAELVIVGEPSPTPDDARYLEQLRSKCSLPLWYRCVNVERGQLFERV